MYRERERDFILRAVQLLAHHHRVVAVASQARLRILILVIVMRLLIRMLLLLLIIIIKIIMMMMIMIIIIMINGRGGCSGWGAQGMAGTGGATGRTLARASETHNLHPRFEVKSHKRLHLVSTTPHFAECRFYSISEIDYNL